MIAFPHAKINIGLYITEKRSDGYHNIETLFYPISLSDVLEIVRADKLSFSTSGLPVPDDGKDNLVLRTYQLLQESYDLPPAHIHLHKVIPMGAGLGGGSSDAAFTIRLVNQLFELNLPFEDQLKIAAKIGSDCPFFLYEGPKLGTGRGTDLHDVDFSLKGHYLVLVTPNVHLSTAEAYAGIVPKAPATPLLKTLKDPNLWSKYLINDFENVVFKKYPELAQIRQDLYEAGAYYVAMSGSGSALFGLFKEIPSDPIHRVMVLEY